MTRVPIATVAGLAFFIAYVALAATLADALPANGAVRLIYFAIAGFVWVFPIRWLMLWAARLR